MLSQRIGQMLVDAGHITIAQLSAAQAFLADHPGTDLIRFLTDRGYVTPSQLSQCFEQQLGIGYTDPAGISLSPELAQLVPRELARTYRVLPIRAADDTLQLAMVDPLDLAAAEAVRNATRRKVVPMLAPADAIDTAISRLYGPATAEQALQAMHIGEAAATPSVSDLSDSRDSDAPTIRLVNSFLEFALSRGASDIHLEPRERELAVRMRIDGILHEPFTVPKASQNSVIARVKVMGELDLAEHRLPQDGRCSIRLGGTHVDLRISTLPTIHGEKAVIRLLRRDTSLLTPDGIGLTGPLKEAFSRLISQTSGVILVAGPTGSGKSSTLYTMIGELNTGQVNLVTLEDPVEYHFDRVNQVQIRENTGLTFVAGLRSVLRQDPDIIAVGEIRDTETADIAMRAAITGHLVLSTVHTGSAPEAIARLLDMGVAPYLIASGLKGIVAQRLVRKICPHCKETYHPSAPELRALQLPEIPGRVFSRGRGCPHCFQTGYAGRTAVFEILTVTPGIRRCISEGLSRDALDEKIRESGFRPMRFDCIRLLEAGITTPEEILRTLRSSLDGGRL